MLKNVINIIPVNKRIENLLKLNLNQETDRQFLLDMLPKKSIGVEIGVHIGDFSQQIIDTVSPVELNLIDPWEYHSSSVYKTAWYGGEAKGGQAEMDERYLGVHDKFEKLIKTEQVKVHRGYSTDMLRQFPDQYFDWVYIDGNHLYEYAKQDLELSFLKVKPDGYITGDDYTDGGWWKGGVKKAVDEFSNNYEVQLIKIRNKQFIFRKRNKESAGN